MLRSIVAVSSRVATGARALSTSTVSMTAPSKAAVKEVSKDKSSARSNAPCINRVEILGEVFNKSSRIAGKNGHDDFVLFNVATNSTVENESGEAIDRTARHTVTAFGKVADAVEAKVEMGMRVHVHGRNYMGGRLNENGSRTPLKVTIVADKVEQVAE
ncbi:hypothetical protein PMAYCL1PPCAC_11068 [Pristionchus mayeri]|uniref:Uncharacterized protein n=1 Tax=Pristionchus mayeri TaxID=1317129 RepID=A0AAN4ZLY3_9BILA|nr:hypothetical protein PMAYCL1PPCAC_11068 [Pristionchus mayeri]